MRIKGIFKWYDFWIGLFLDRKNQSLYIFPVPMLGIVITIGKNTFDINLIPINKKLPKEGVEVVLFNEKWIDPDFNPKGIRVGFLNGTGEWVSAHWCNQHDEYHTRYSDEDNKKFTDYKAINQIPTHWKEIKLP